MVANGLGFSVNRIIVNIGDFCLSLVNCSKFTRITKWKFYLIYNSFTTWPHDTAWLVIVKICNIITKNRIKSRSMFPTITIDKKLKAKNRYWLVKDDFRSDKRVHITTKDWHWTRIVPQICNLHMALVPTLSLLNSHPPCPARRLNFKVQCVH